MTQRGGEKMRGKSIIVTFTKKDLEELANWWRDEGQNILSIVQGIAP